MNFNNYKEKIIQNLIIGLLVFLIVLPLKNYILYGVFGLDSSPTSSKSSCSTHTPPQAVQQEVKIVERLVASSESWSHLQALIKNSVVQIFTQSAQIDILQPHKSPTPNRSSGSGFFINKEGNIITNWHVVDQAKVIYIQIPEMGKEQFDVEVVGLSPDRDLALLRLTAESHEKIIKALGAICYLKLGDSDEVFRGDEIMTIGYPLGFQSIKSTKGIVSGIEQHLIQIDAPINPGNSGGPSINLKGEVIGINTAYIANAQNIGYIITVNELKIILEDLTTVPLLKKPFLGVLFNNGSAALTTFLKNPQPGGLYVVQTYKNSPLQKAGVLPRDMIYAIDGHAIDVYGELAWKDEKISLIDYVARLKLGQEVHLVLYRQGVRKELTFNFYQAEMLPIKKIYPGYETIDYEIIGGMLIQPLTYNHIPLLISNAPGLTKYAEMRYQTEPLLICTYLYPDCAIGRLKALTPGMIIKEINGTAVHTLKELRTLLYESMKTGYLSIETTDSIFGVFPIDKIILDEQRLSADYFYAVTPGMKQLIAQYGKKTSSTEIDNPSVV